MAKYARISSYEEKIPDLMMFGLTPDESNYPVDCWLLDVNKLTSFVFDDHSNPKSEFHTVRELSQIQSQSFTQSGSYEGIARYIPLNEAVEASSIRKLV